MAVWINHTWEEGIAQEGKCLKELYDTSYKKTKEYILSMGEREYMVSISGGKDSDIIYYITSRVFNELQIDNYMLNYFNTTNETSTIYKHVKNDYDKERLYIHNPDKGWYTWLKEDKKWYLPSVMSRNAAKSIKRTSLNYFLIRKKGISSSLAQESMSLKIYGRFEESPSDMGNKRVLHCKKCMCKMQGWKQKDYKNKVMEFRNQGCELF